MEKSLCLRDKYWVLRHVKSIPNEKGLIVSFILLLHIFLRILCLFISQFGDFLSGKWDQGRISIS
ncbi:hypothetical protein NC653_012074 [Populus alba x Populus x berolinensis]|uniref:Uncharacterized protein n=1 Tax=Populus alba x Populus x berolinensis TaxID=444605 RepID=A0AAD6W7B1_9ROSI|nr:hypothetical protein NC653_012074 [Populus alba x Populus x berolinensis]